MAKSPTPVNTSTDGPASGTVVVDNTDAASAHAVEAERTEKELEGGTVQVNYV